MRTAAKLVSTIAALGLGGCASIPPDFTSAGVTPVMSYAVTNNPTP